MQSKTLTDDIAAILANEGFSATKFGITTPKTGDKVSLEIGILDEGPHTTLRSVRIIGIKKEGIDVVTRFLGLHEGQPIGLGQIAETQLKLWSCGRFKKHLVTVVPVDENADVAVTFDLMEYPDLPPLDGPLPPVEQGLLKFRAWILARWEAGDDIALEFHDERGRFECIVSRAGGSFRLHYVPPVVPATSPTTQPSWSTRRWDFAGAFAGDRIALYSYLTGAKLVSWNKPSLAVNFTAKVYTTIDSEGNPKSAFNIGGGWKGGISPPPGMTADISLAPAQFIEMAHKDDMKCAIRDGELIITGDKLLCRIEAGTGRLIEMKSENIELSARPHALQEQLAALERDFPGPNSFDPKEPTVSTAVFFADEFVRASFFDASAGPGQKRAIQAMIKLLSPQVLAPLSRCHFPFAGDSDFFIPGNPRFMRGSNMFTKMVLSFGLPGFQDLFERGSWPWVLAREQMLIYAGQTADLSPELERILDSGKIGPLGDLLTSILLEQLSREGAADVARQGLHELNIVGFDKDVAVLTQGPSISAELLRRVADALRHLPKEDTDALADTLKPEYAGIFQSFVTALHVHPEDPIDKALPYALDEIWPDVIHVALQGALQAHVPGA